MTQVSRKGFVDKNGQKVVIVPPKEEYAGKAIFQESDAIDTILSEGVHHISYKRDGKSHPSQHILVVRRDYGKTKPIAPTREIVYQLLIDDLGGMMKRYRKFTDTELLEPDGDWTEWVSMIPTVDSTITEDGSNPVTGAAIYAALAGKAGIYNGTIRVDSAGNNSYPIPEGGVVQTALDSFVESSEQDKMYNVLAQFVILAAGFAHYCPAIVYWSIDSEDSTIIMHIHAGDYRFVATKQEGATAWKQEKFDKSSFLETF